MWLTNKVVEVSKRIVLIEEALANGDLMRNEADQLRAEREDLEQLNEIFNAYLKIAGQSYELQIKIARLEAERDALKADNERLKALAVAGADLAIDVANTGIEATKRSDELQAENAALVALVSKEQGFIENVMANIGAGATLDEVADMLCDWWDSPKQTPEQCLREIEAEAGRAGYIQALKDFAPVIEDFSESDFKAADIYAAKLRKGGE